MHDTLRESVDRLNMGEEIDLENMDLRVRYTRMVIEDSFLKLLQEKPVSKITVTEICQQAHINRGTFYKHYPDVPGLLEAMEGDLFQHIREAFGNDIQDTEQFLVKMLNYTLSEKDKFWALGGDNGDPNLMTKTFRLCYEWSYPLMLRNLPNITESQRHMLLHYITQGCGGILTGWIRDGMQESIEEIAAYMLKLSVATINGI